LYPAGNPQTHVRSIALYDRDTGRSEQIFPDAKSHSITNLPSDYLRAEWLSDGKHILVAQAQVKEGLLSLSVIPRGVKEPPRHIFLPDRSDDAVLAVLYPFAVVGSKVFLNGGKRLTRVDWMTGEVRVVTNDPPVITLPGGDGKTILGMRGVGKDGEHRPVEYGTVDPRTMKFSPRGTFQCQTNEDECVMPLIVLATGEQYFCGGGETNSQLRVLKGGKELFNRRIVRGSDKVIVSGPWPELAPKKDRVFAAYLSQTAGQTNCEYGLLEIPLKESPLRFTPLFNIQTGSLDKLQGIFPLIQPSLSHDGRTWAVSSAWLVVGEEKDRFFIRPEDCALYLVQVDGSNRPITKVPIQPPPGNVEEKK
jgi:hypothetical protein